MADEYGLSAEGFKQKRLTDIIQSMNSRIADQLGVQISTEANSVFGQLIGVFSYEIADLWEQTAQVYALISAPPAAPTAVTNSGFHVAARAVPQGHAVVLTPQTG